MLSKCLNPLCSTPFRYLHEGRIFNLDTVSPSPDGHGMRAHHVEHFWLCSSCMQRLQVVIEDGHIFTRPLPNSARRQKMNPEPEVEVA